MRAARAAVEGHTERRTLVSIYATGQKAETRVVSQRQLPTDHDHDGGHSPIREYQSDQPSKEPPRALPGLPSSGNGSGPPNGKQGADS